MLHCLARSSVAGETRPLMTPVTSPFHESHCSAMPSWVSKPLVSTMAPDGSGTPNTFPSVRTPSTSMRSMRMLAAVSFSADMFFMVTHGPLAADRKAMNARVSGRRCAGAWHVDRHQHDGSINGAEPVRCIFRDDHKIALCAGLGFSAFDSRPAQIFGVVALFVD